jgi:ribosomal-protein-alanine N-acetyltransferase
VVDSYLISKVSHRDLDDILNIEQETQVTPWSAHVFSDCLIAEYVDYKINKGSNVLGYYFASLYKDECHLLNIAVTSSLHGIGIGKNLMNHFINLCKSASVAGVYLEVRESNNLAIQFYKKQGFVEISIRRNYYRANFPDVRENALIFKLDI